MATAKRRNPPSRSDPCHLSPPIIGSPPVLAARRAAPCANRIPDETDLDGAARRGRARKDRREAWFQKEDSPNRNEDQSYASRNGRSPHLPVLPAAGHREDERLPWHRLRGDPGYQHRGDLRARWSSVPVLGGEEAGGAVPEMRPGSDFRCGKDRRS